VVEVNEKDPTNDVHMAEDSEIPENQKVKRLVHQLQETPNVRNQTIAQMTR